MKMRLAYLSILILMYSCSSTLTSSNYISYVAEHPQDFQVTKVSAANYELTYVPVEKLVAENMENMSKEEAKAEYKKMKSLPSSSFSLRISVEQGNLLSQSKFPKTEQAEYYSVTFKRDVKAITQNSDTLDCSAYLFQAGSTFGNSSYFELEFPEALKNIKQVVLMPKYLEDSLVVIDLAPLKHSYPELKIK